MKDLVILCERCAKSENCMVLVPCKNFSPEQSSNFMLDVMRLSKSLDIEPVYS